MQKLIVDPEKFMDIMLGLKPSAMKVLLYFLMTKKFGEPFKITFWEISKQTGVRNSHAVVTQLVEDGVLTKSVKNNSMTLMLLIQMVVDHDFPSCETGRSDGKK